MQTHTGSTQAPVPAHGHLNTPFLMVDKPKFIDNLNRLRSLIAPFGVALRPHFKTIRAIEAAAYVLPNAGSPVTVSTLREAEALAEAGYRNITYAVGISAAKLPRVGALIEQGVTLTVLLDSLEQVQAVNDYCAVHRCTIPALIEVDCDGHRGGILPEDPWLIELARLLADGPAQFQGVLLHAGESYRCYRRQGLQEAADNEVAAALRARNALAARQIPCPVVSVGSTPTAFSYRQLEGVTEVRAGVYSFFDLVMANIGVCELEDIALSVVATVIGHNQDKGWVLVDAGWMALSADRGTARAPVDYGYGQVASAGGAVMAGMQVLSVNQEHGIIGRVDGHPLCFEDFPIGSRVRILPNHACATAAMHDQYQVVDDLNGTHEVWHRIKGW